MDHLKDEQFMHDFLLEMQIHEMYYLIKILKAIYSIMFLLSTYSWRLLLLHINLKKIKIYGSSH
jgi:hypothetical protein